MSIALHLLQSALHLSRCCVELVAVCIALVALLLSRLVALLCRVCRSQHCTCCAFVAGSNRALEHLRGKQNVRRETWACILSNHGSAEQCLIHGAIVRNS